MKIQSPQIELQNPPIRHCDIFLSIGENYKTYTGMLTYIQCTHRPTYQPTDKNMQSSMPSFFERGYNGVSMLRRVVQFTTEKIGALDNVQ